MNVEAPLKEVFQWDGKRVQKNKRMIQEGKEGLLVLLVSKRHNEKR